MVGLFKRRPSDAQAPLDLRTDTPIASKPGGRLVEETIPLVAEKVIVDKRQVEGDTVRVDVRTETDVETVTAELLRDAVDVKRVAIDEPVDQLPVTRVEGDVTIIPIVRERLVVQRQLVLTEELHITHARERISVEREVELRRQVPEVTRTPSTVLDPAE